MRTTTITLLCLCCLPIRTAAAEKGIIWGMNRIGEALIEPMKIGKDLGMELRRNAGSGRARNLKSYRWARHHYNCRFHNEATMNSLMKLLSSELEQSVKDSGAKVAEEPVFEGNGKDWRMEYTRGSYRGFFHLTSEQHFGREQGELRIFWYEFNESEQDAGGKRE